MLKIHKETKVDTRPSTAGSVVSISAPSSADGAPQRSVRFSVQAKAAHEDITTTKDEDAFAKRYLATQGSVYFRQRRSYPRGFLWRVVGDDRTLELRSIDLTKSANEAHEAHLTLRLEFQDAILPHGVALADPEDHDVLSVFVITSARQLYTFTLRPEFFRRPASVDENIADCCKICRPAPLNFSYPHRLYASSPLELLVSLDNGALLRLTRRAGDDGTFTRWPHCVVTSFFNFFQVLLLTDVVRWFTRYDLDSDYIRREDVGCISPGPGQVECTSINKI